ncbi:HD domain-containing protein [Mangrovibacterium lignilyticum]|uniref:HD domain-containing protein n=1 Tax=Mangrovibacterium lignilyticum TaxID=2668052 RepID=UPI0013D320DD|nr:HD domain-containing protein [Mangrovibacterium lignilyticum]
MRIIELKKMVTDKLKAELSEKLTYHGVHHTLGVLDVCEDYIERMNITPKEAELLQTAALLHDTGFIWTYTEHEERSIAYAREILPEWNYSQPEIEIIAGMIRSTKIPQKANTVLEQIIGDADLDYLGTDSFPEISETLYQELEAFHKIQNREEWELLQISFLTNHRFHTAYARKYREPVKQVFLQELLSENL